MRTGHRWLSASRAVVSLAICAVVGAPVLASSGPVVSPAAAFGESDELRNLEPVEDKPSEDPVGEVKVVPMKVFRTELPGAPATDDPLVRQRLAQAYIETDIVRLVAWRQVSEVMRRGQPGPEGSYLKLLWSEVDMRTKELGIELEGPYGAIDGGSPRAVDGGRWQYEYLWSRAASIYAGTSEVQRNIIAQRVLGLPRG